MSTISIKKTCMWVAAVLVAFSSVSSCKDYDDDINSLNDRLTAVEGDVNDLQDAIEAGKLITSVTPFTTGDGGWTITFSDNSKIDVKNGAKGDKGDTGATGAQGDKGDKGDTGATGANGLTPFIGSNGNWWIGTTDTGVKAQGDKGEAGEDGKTPYIGDNGNWFIGTTDTGVKAQGPQGEKGEKGDDGILDIKENGMVYDIYLLDGRVFRIAKDNPKVESIQADECWTEDYNKKFIILARVNPSNATVDASTIKIQTREFVQTWTKAEDFDFNGPAYLEAEPEVKQLSKADMEDLYGADTKVVATGGEYLITYDVTDVPAFKLANGIFDSEDDIPADWRGDMSDIAEYFLFAEYPMVSSSLSLIAASEEELPAVETEMANCRSRECFAIFYDSWKDLYKGTATITHEDANDPACGFWSSDVKSVTYYINTIEDLANAKIQFSYTKDDATYPYDLYYRQDWPMYTINRYSDNAFADMTHVTWTQALNNTLSVTLDAKTGLAKVNLSTFPFVGVATDGMAVENTFNFGLDTKCQRPGVGTFQTERVYSVLDDPKTTDTDERELAADDVTVIVKYIKKDYAVVNTDKRYIPITATDKILDGAALNTVFLGSALPHEDSDVTVGVPTFTLNGANYDGSETLNFACAEGNKISLTATKFIPVGKYTMTIPVTIKGINFTVTYPFEYVLPTYTIKILSDAMPRLVKKAEYDYYYKVEFEQPTQRVPIYNICDFVSVPKVTGVDLNGDGTVETPYGYTFDNKDARLVNYEAGKNNGQGIIAFAEGGTAITTFGQAIPNKDIPNAGMDGTVQFKVALASGQLADVILATSTDARYSNNADQGILDYKAVPNKVFKLFEPTDTTKETFDFKQAQKDNMIAQDLSTIIPAVTFDYGNDIYTFTPDILKTVYGFAEIKNDLRVKSIEFTPAGYSGTQVQDVENLIENLNAKIDLETGKWNLYFDFVDNSTSGFNTTAVQRIKFTVYDYFGHSLAGYFYIKVKNDTN